MKEEIKYNPLHKVSGKAGINFKDIETEPRALIKDSENVQQENISEIEQNNKKNYKIIHLPELDILLNLDSEEEDRKMILGILKKKPLGEDNSMIGPFYDIDSIKSGNERYFFTKTKGNTNNLVDYNKGRTTEHPINPKLRYDFDKKSIYAMASISNEMHLSRKVKEIVDSREVQELAKKYFFDNMKFAEPVIALLYKRFNVKYLIYKNIKQVDKNPFFYNNRMAQDLAIELREIFIKNGIKPHDLRDEQFLITKNGIGFSIVLIDIEAYTEIKK